jgi:arylsulfatase A-like enzyme
MYSNITIRVLLFLLTGGLCLFSSLGAGDRPPNFVVIMADDLGYGDLSCYGAPVIETPVLDRMAEEGVRFTDFYAPAAQCTPTRAAFLTGSYAQRINTHRIFGPGGNIGLNPDEITLPELLQSVGYTTAVIGKWHLGTAEPFEPNNHGFDYFYGFLHPDYFSKETRLIHRNREVIETGPESSRITDELTDEAIAFIEQNRDSPFFLFLSHDMPHIPLEIPAERRGMSNAGIYGDVIEHLDQSVGRVLASLEESGLLNETIVIFTSDNGPAVHWGVEGGSAGPLRGSKHTALEGGFRVPFIVWGPGIVAPDRTIREVATLMDLYPTFADWTGALIPTDRVIDGRDIRPLLMGDESARSPHEAFFFYKSVRDGAKIEGVRQGRWKLRIPLAHHLAEKTPASEMVFVGYGMEEKEKVLSMAERRDVIRSNSRVRDVGANREEVGLYDLKADPGESINLAAEYPELVEELRTLMEAFDESLRANSRPLGRL